MDQEKSNQYMSSNAAYIDSSILKLRLDTEKLLENIELFLQGQKIVSVIDNGVPKIEVVQYGTPMLNSEGVQAIMSYLSLIFAPHSVQGNFKDMDYRNFIKELDNNISCNIMENIEAWDVQISKYNHIIDGIMSAAEMFVSRLIDNKERDSYNATLRSVESTVQQQNRGLFGGG